MFNERLLKILFFKPVQLCEPLLFSLACCLSIVITLKLNTVIRCIVFFFLLFYVVSPRLNYISFVSKGSATLDHVVDLCNLSSVVYISVR